MSVQNSGQLGGNSHEFFAPLGYIPLTATKLRRWGDLRVKEGFLGALVGALVGQGTESALYPWRQAPYLLAVSEGQILLDNREKPLDLAQAIELKRAQFVDYSASPQSQAHLLYAGEVAGTQGQEIPVLALTGQWEDFLNLGQNLVLVGPDGEQIGYREVLAAQTGGHWVPLRELAELAYEDEAADFRQWSELLSGLLALIFWHASHGFDPASGQPTTVAQAGWSRVTASGREIFPRTDPAVITAVTAQIAGEEKILLGQARAWEKNRFSTFAGFVEAGESLENAVVREVFEECGGQVSALEYLGSQPWPFPRSLMLGFRAEISNPQTVQADGEEIAQIRWFSREELEAAHISGQVVLPGRASISRKLIENFLGRPLPQSSQ